MDINNRSLEVDAFWEGRQHVSPPARWFSTQLAEEVPPENTWRVLTLTLVQTINLSALSVLGIFSRPCPVLHVDTSCGLTLERRQTC